MITSNHSFSTPYLEYAFLPNWFIKIYTAKALSVGILYKETYIRRLEQSLILLFNAYILERGAQAFKTPWLKMIGNHQSANPLDFLEKCEGPQVPFKG